MRCNPTFLKNICLLWYYLLIWKGQILYLMIKEVVEDIFSKKN